MLEKLTGLVSDAKQRDLLLVGGGMLGLMTGAKATPLALFAVGARGLEKHWRRANPDFQGGLGERWDRAIEFYDQTHQDRVNRALHTIGIPMIVGGAVGMVVSPRWTAPWWIANGSWTAGWALNFVGHAFFEKSAPAFAEDPLSFFAGPVWDFVRLQKKLTAAVTTSASSEARVEAAPAA